MPLIGTLKHRWQLAHRSAYLKENRLPDLLAAVQAMAQYDEYRKHVDDWADLISGDKARGPYWKAIFEEHPEFFRQSSRPDHYALIWRRAQARRFHRQLMRVITQEEYEAMPPERRGRYLSHPPVPPDQIKTLMDTAIGLHGRAVDAQHDWRWWVAPSIAAVSSFVGAVIGGLIKH